MSTPSPSRSPETLTNRFRVIVFGGVLLLGLPAWAQQPPVGRPEPPAPQSKPADPLPGDQGKPNEPLSDRLERDQGVIAPPSGIAPDNSIVPSDPGRIRVIPPPGSPQGDPAVQPK